MSTATPPPSEAAGRTTALPTGLYRLTVEQFMQIADAGVFRDDRVELLGGAIFAKMTKNPPHNFTSGEVFDVLHRAIPAGWFVEKETPARLDRSWQPEPDVMVVRGTRRDYRDRFIGPQDIALLVEVADESSRRRDRGTKLRGYARAGVPVYWVVDLVARVIEVYTEPTGPADRPLFRHLTTYRPEDEVTVAVEGREVARFAVKDLLP